PRQGRCRRSRRRRRLRPSRAPPRARSPLPPQSRAQPCPAISTSSAPPVFAGSLAYPRFDGYRVGRCSTHTPVAVRGRRDHIRQMSSDTMEMREAASDDPASRPTGTLLAGGHRRAEGGHPWIFSNEVQMDAAAKGLDPGSLVTLRRSDGGPLGVAMFNPHTLLAARLLDRDTARPIGRRILIRRITRALRLRERLF